MHREIEIEIEIEHGDREIEIDIEIELYNEIYWSNGKCVQSSMSLMLVTIHTKHFNAHVSLEGL